ncbi:hypothetical protein [Actinomadura rubrisoli]|uniref:Uncharacterized protein n=1 Tax=Actinomadura rubrisoli TaxID=2530368 RepID=A0A4R5B926_9ACTN|nr:hypothetical protein [Actinomadura rubrisoli]TDD80214.1 hypothetical protein E1298_26230 [Actinomadura rubrisoli]
MIDDDARPPGPDDFIAELNAFYESCNRPPYRKLAEISEHLGELYGRRGLPVLSATAVFEVLAGRRKRVPSSAWVASFILCCQRRAWETGVRADDPGISSLPHWQARLRAAQAAPPPASDGAPAQAAPDEQTQGEQAPGDDADRQSSVPYARTPPEADAAVPCRLTEAQRTTIADYGDHGRALLNRAARGDTDALYRIAVLLGTDSAREPEAVALLIEAAAAGHPRSLDLLDADPGGFDHLQAARDARRLGDAATIMGSPATALAYYKAAVQGGLLDAAFKITEILRDAGTEHADSSWLAPADTDAPNRGRS